ncbi:MAG: hypothetical protein ABR501_03855 [Pyrinomonadaceae bacterium]
MKLPGIRPLAIRGIQAIVLLGVCYAPVVRGQDPNLQETVAPPPLKIILRAERAQISEAKDAKGRLRMTLELAGAHLANAETETAKQNYDGAASEAGRYWALVEDLFAFLKTTKRDSDKTRDLYKRLELTLRAQGPRLSAMRRGTPSEYAVWIKEIEDFARRGRTEALNSFYGDTVVRDSVQKPSDQKSANKSLQKGAIVPE